MTELHGIPLGDMTDGHHAAVAETLRQEHRLVACPLPQERVARSARGIVREVLRDAAVDEAAASDAELAIAELAANAVTHADGPYELRFIIVGGWPIWCEILDAGQDLAGIPELFAKLHGTAAPDDLAETGEPLPESGHGLAIVHQLSGGRCWVYPAVLCSTGQLGKAVAFALPGGGR